MLRDSVVLKVDGISISGQLFLPDTQNTYPLICLCHGAPSGNPPEPGDGGYPALAESICKAGFGAFFFNFRGTGDSGGNIDFLGWTRDLQEAIKYLRHSGNINAPKLYLVGFSAGAAVSIYVASKDECISGVAACACPAHFGLFTDVDEPQVIIDRYRDIGAIRDADFPPSLDWWLENLRQVTPIEHVSSIASRPLLFIHGTNDETVPISHCYQMYELAGKPKKLVILEGAGHRLRREDGVISTILNWIVSS